VGGVDALDLLGPDPHVLRYVPSTSRPSTSWGRRGAGRCAETGVDSKDLARKALGGLRRAEVGRFYLYALPSRAAQPAVPAGRGSGGGGGRLRM